MGGGDDHGALQLGQRLDGGAASAWLGRRRTDGGMVDALGGSIQGQLSDGVSGSARGRMAGDDTSRASAGLF